MKVENSYSKPLSKRLKIDYTMDLKMKDKMILKLRKKPMEAAL
jgi:hypothetical protein